MQENELQETSDVDDQMRDERNIDDVNEEMLDVQDEGLEDDNGQEASMDNKNAIGTQMEFEEEQGIHSETNNVKDDMNDKTDSFCGCNKDDASKERERKEKRNDLESCNSLFSREELIDYFEKLKLRKCPEKDRIMIGMVGFPNVGKSSTINALLGDKKTSVSSTPGKTKHFQVHFCIFKKFFRLNVWLAFLHLVSVASNNLPSNTLHLINTSFDCLLDDKHQPNSLLM